MYNVTNFCKNNFLLCVCTGGLAVIGYLGYHTVRQIINGFLNIEIVKHVAQKIFKNYPDKDKKTHLEHTVTPIITSSSSSPSSSNSSKITAAQISSVSLYDIRQASDLEISPGKITAGQGEYIVFHQLPNGKKQEVSSQTFEAVYQLIIQHSPAELAKDGNPEAAANCANRYTLLKTKIKEIDNSLEIVFIPKTLYELFFIEECIKEDLAHGNVCKNLDKSVQYAAHYPTDNKLDSAEKRKAENNKKLFEENRVKRNCWHLCIFEDAGDNHHAGVKNVAYRLNNLLFNTLKPTNEGFTYEQIKTFAERKIDFLKQHRENNLNESTRCNIFKGRVIVSNKDYPSPTTNFGTDSSRVAKPMSICNNRVAQIIRDAVALDCSKIALHSLFLYRGANFANDSVVSSGEENMPHSLSLGSGLFAGCLYDPDATAFYYMRNDKNDAFAIPVPYDQLQTSPFYAPIAHTIAQLYGRGELFHGRTKAWKNCDLSKIERVDNGNSNNHYHSRDHLKSDYTKNELKSEFMRYKAGAIRLKA